MRRGNVHLLIGLALLLFGIGITVVSKEIVGYGAVIVGAIEVLRGVRARRRPS